MQYSGEINVYVRYTAEGLKNRYSVTEGILGMDSGILSKYYEGSITEEEYTQWFSEGAAGTEYCENYYLVCYETFDFKGTVMTGIYSLAAVVILIIIFTSVVCI